MARGVVDHVGKRPSPAVISNLESDQEVFRTVWIVDQYVYTKVQNVYQ
jgi:hypothetical protein